MREYKEQENLIFFIIPPCDRLDSISNFVFQYWELALHKNWSFQLRISLVNVTKSAVFCEFGHIDCRNP